MTVISSVLVIQSHDSIYIGSDSAVSIEHNDQLYRLHNYGLKLFHIEDKVIFCSGSMELSYKVVNQFSRCPLKNIEKLQEIAFNCYNEHPNKDVFTLEILVATIVNNQSIVYQISPYNDFEIITSVLSPSERAILTGGIKTSEVFESAYSALAKDHSVDVIYQNVFDSISYEGIGGFLQVYKVSNDGINLTYKSKIKENNIQFFDPHLLNPQLRSEHLIVGERIYGRIITGERVVVGDPDGILEIRGNKMVITDRNQREVMWFGLYDTKPDRFGVKLENDLNQVIMDRDDGFTINRKKGIEWHKILWLDTNGIIHSEGLVTKNIKIFSDKNELLLDAEEGIIDLRPINGHLGQNITLSTKDGICVTRGNGLNRIWLNSDSGIAIEKRKDNRWFKTFYVDLDGKLVAEELVAKRLTIINSRDETLLDQDALNFDFTTLDSIILDDVIISSEKVTLLNQVRSLQQTYQTLLSQIDTYLSQVFTDREKSYPELDKAKNKLEAAKSKLVAKYNRLVSYVTPVFIDMNKSTSITKDLHSNRTEFYQVFKDYHEAATLARNSLENFLEKSSLQLGRDYNNVVIDAENGITVTRGDNLVKTILNATEGIKIERKEGGSWEKKFYVDTNGILYAEDLVAKRLILLGGESGEDLIIDANTKFMDLNQFDKIVGNLQAENITAKAITADEGFIADLCVNQQKTINPDAETSTRNYIHIHDQYIKWITGQATGSTTSSK
ncbi:hypothetical protein C4A75_09555 [Brevibacillus laterosporus]|uniref:hypothetical protein n=1 Tax=Brevibacillus laterosporus TaxID=1465 RepID=UPI000CE46FC0|nr:hypothetical protein [Brevibacillus laterosporus]PPA85013.1 hypothetical protein C4A75_09555 [Brevibacillus laterosporus]